jgi:hypothetical protein
LSRNSVSQPFFLVCEKDSVIAQLQGSASITFRGASVNYFEMRPGDFIYVPGGTPHRIHVDKEGLQLRYKAAVAGLEAVIWYCENCGGELYRNLWDTTVVLPQEGYLRACTNYNDDGALRKCTACGRGHEPLDLSCFRWREVAAALREEESSESLV